MRPLLALARKDLQMFLSDRRAVILAFLVPVMLASFMALIFGGAGEGGGGRGKIEVRIADQDQSAVSKEIVNGLGEDSNLALQAVPVETAKEDVLKGRAVAAVILPKGFGSAASKALFGVEAKPEVTLVRDPSHAAESGMIRGILMQHIMQAVSTNAFSGSQARTNLKEALDQIGTAQALNPTDRTELSNMLNGILKWQEYSEANQRRDGDSASLPSGSMTLPFETKEDVVAAGNKDDKTAMYAHSFSGMAVQFVLFGAIEAGVGLLTERQRGLWKRLRAAPLSRLTLLGGRAISGAIIALLVLSVVFLCGMILFGIRVQGSVIGFGLVTVSYALCAATFGLLIAALGKTPQAARGFSILVVLLMVLLGGAWMPTFLFPAWLQRVTPIIPTRWAIDGFDGTLFRKFTLVEALGPVTALMGFALVFATLTWMRFRWEAE